MSVRVARSLYSRRRWHSRRISLLFLYLRWSPALHSMLQYSALFLFVAAGDTLKPLAHFRQVRISSPPFQFELAEPDLCERWHAAEQKWRLAIVKRRT